MGIDNTAWERLTDDSERDPLSDEPNGPVPAGDYIIVGEWDIDDGSTVLVIAEVELPEARSLGAIYQGDIRARVSRLYAADGSPMSEDDRDGYESGQWAGAAVYIAQSLTDALEYARSNHAEAA